MARRVSPLLLLLPPVALAAALAGCSGPVQKPQRPAWRTQAENACIARRLVQPSAYVQIAHELEGPGICGLTRPFKVTALQGGAVSFNATATLDCNMVAELDQWVTDVVQPAARARFGVDVAQINSMGSYSCRGMNNQRGAPLSEHSFGNALDIGGFVLADGRQISIVKDWWRGDEQTKAFLMDVHGGSCKHFSTVLSPGSNAFHYNHIHVDLAMHGRSGKHICKPYPSETVAPPSVISKDGPSVEDDDSDTGERPPLAAFQGAGAGPRDAIGPIAAPETPLPPRRDVEVDEEPTGSIGKKHRP